MRHHRLPAAVVTSIVCTLLALGSVSAGAATKRVAPTFTVKVNPTAVSLNAGQQAALQVIVTKSSTFRSRINFTLVGLPAGAGIVRSTAIKNGLLILLSAPANAVSSRSTVGLVADGGGIVRRVPFTLQVNGSAPAPATTAPPATVAPTTTAPVPVGDYTLSIDPGLVTVATGGAVRFAVFVNPSGGFKGNVRFELKGLPTGAQAAFIPQAHPSGTTLLITTTAATPKGDYLLTVNGYDGARFRSVNFTLRVITGADFSISVTAAATTLAPGGSTTLTVYVAPLTTTSVDVDLTVSGLPSGGTVTPVTAKTGQNAYFTVQFPANTTPAIYRITVTGVSGSFTKSAFADITIMPVVAVQLSPSAISTPRGTTANYAIIVSSTTGIAPALVISATPPNSTSTILIGSDGSRTLQITPSANTPVGTYTVTVTAYMGTTSASASATLTVT